MSNFNWCHGPYCHRRQTTTRVRGVKGHKVLRTRKVQADRDWDNPYDPRSNRSLWTPDSLKIVQKSENEIQLSWLRRGRDFDGFIIDKKIGPGDWLDSVAVLWDSTFSWIDTLDLKDLVLNPYLYKYRIYAYADTNTSLKKIDQFQPTIPGPPGSLSISNITYTHIPKKTLSISWQQSLDLDFHSYNIHHAFSENGTRSLFRSIYDVETTSLDTNQFTVNNENWFWVEIVDTTGQKTLGNAFSIPRDPPPAPSSLDSIHYNNQKQLLLLGHIKQWEAQLTTHSNKSTYRYMFMMKIEKWTKLSNVIKIC